MNPGRLGGSRTAADWQPGLPFATIVIESGRHVTLPTRGVARTARTRRCRLARGWAARELVVISSNRHRAVVVSDDAASRSTAPAADRSRSIRTSSPDGRVNLPSCCPCSSRAARHSPRIVGTAMGMPWAKNRSAMHGCLGLGRVLIDREGTLGRQAPLGHPGSGLRAGRTSACRFARGRLPRLVPGLLGCLRPRGWRGRVHVRADAANCDRRTGSGGSATTRPPRSARSRLGFSLFPSAAPRPSPGLLSGPRRSCLDPGKTGPCFLGGGCSPLGSECSGWSDPDREGRLASVTEQPGSSRMASPTVEIARQHPAVSRSPVRIDSLCDLA